jgi:hypothetical protein
MLSPPFQWHHTIEPGIAEHVPSDIQLGSRGEHSLVKDHFNGAWTGGQTLPQLFDPRRLGLNDKERGGIFC